MTVIKVFNNEKKPIDQDPLVDNVVLPEPDVEAGQDNSNNVTPHMILMRNRAKHASTLTTLLLIATSSLVLTIGICGGFYIYKQFVHSRAQHYKTICNIPYYDEEIDPFANSIAIQDKLMNDDQDILLNKFAKSADIFETIAQEERDMLNNIRPPRKEFREDIEFDLNSQAYEKIHVPEFPKGRNSQFIHDFHSNMTAIIDLQRQTCFIMPLNRSVVLPPRSLLDLIQKMWSGYYTMSPSQFTETYRAIDTPMEDLSSLGKYIANECQNFPVYKLEKAVGGIVKRSAEFKQDNKAFTVLDGNKPRAIEIVNIEEITSSNKK